MKKTKRKLPEEALNCARLLFRLIKRNNSNNTATAQHGLKWAEVIRRINEIDKQPYYLIKAVIEWSQNDPFWKKNILSGEKLRKQWSQLTIRMDINKIKSAEYRKEQEIADQKERERILSERKDLPDFVKKFRENMSDALKNKIFPIELSKKV